MLDRPAVRSSLARRFGAPDAAVMAADRRTEGVVAMMLDATQNHAASLTAERLFGWQAALFPTGYSGLHRPDPLSCHSCAQIDNALINWSATAESRAAAFVCPMSDIRSQHVSRKAGEKTGGRQMPEVSGYHAHVYFNPATRPVAERLRESIVSRFAVERGGFSDEPRGPHPVSQFNVIFKTEEFQSIVTWLMLNRDGLDVLVHPLTDDMVDDHTAYALWLGTPVNLKLDTMQRRGYRDELLPSASVGLA